jgi:hypothetical protein
MEDAFSLSMYLSLVGLIATYRQLADGRSSGDTAKFQTWLISSGFRDVSAKIDESVSLQAGLAALLEEDSALIKSKLDTIEDVVRSVASRMEGFSKLSEAIPHEGYLSDQACNLIRRLDANESGEMLCHIETRIVKVVFLPTSSGRFEPSEPRFLSDDLSKLESAGWIRLVRHNGSGQPIYAITRRGSEAAKRISGQ